MRLLVTFLESFSLPPVPPVRPIDGATISRVRLQPAEYLALYRDVGTAVSWDSRLHQSPESLRALLEDERFVLYALHHGDSVAGFCEFDTSDPAEIELTHFGILPTQYGKGLGPFLLDRALRAIFERQPRRVWLHTDTEDHPAAQPLYRRFGFRQFDQRFVDFPD